ncbi:MAG TPA: imidazole glycerol phosphate synthase subunit HisH [Spirochaetota bacterium]|nr:imidazole glycerol phosphate synthase subunit HisH [Spirochaetota bacterium]
MIGVIDSKICNIFSLTNMLKKINAPFKIVSDTEDFTDIDKLILPGVGAFPKAMENLNKYNLLDGIISFAKSGKPLMGICLGMQLLFDESEEFGVVKGLCLIPGKIVKIKTGRVLPHMGWNDITIKNNIPLLNGVSQNADVYFVHSYKADCDDKFIAATTEYDEIIPAVVFKGNIFGCQFHPKRVRGGVK